MITMTVAQLMEAEAALNRLAVERLPVRTAHHVAVILRAVKPEIDQFVEVRSALIRELGAARPGGDAPVIEVKPEHREAFFARVQELALVELQLPIDPLEIAALDGAELTAADLIALDRFLV